MARNRNLKRQQEIKLEKLRSHCRENLNQVMEEAAESSALLSGIPYLILTSRSGEVPDEYQKLLETETVGRLITHFMDTDTPRSSILALTDGSELGTLLREVFDWIDQNLTVRNYENLYARSLNAVDAVLKQKIQELEYRKIQLEQEEPNHYYDLSSDDLPF